MDKTSQKIIDVTMKLIKEKGYVATTTIDIANGSHINECTIFRKFKGKKDIVLSGMKQEKWCANVSASIFQDVKWDLQLDLEMFMRNYLERITPDFVSLSVGLRAPQIYEDTMPYIMKIPEAFLQTLVLYFKSMNEKGKIGTFDFECLAMTIFSSTFGFTFLKASFGEQLSRVKQEEYITNSVSLFLKGIQHE
ncbi:TetR family transcriptional regulator [Alkalibaculum sp. M08DMB]|uniref:TetR family transcriptional regulator n=1 Tax=Alkalibaculum sporogenes TaxID=2655001 RepID=A0A6A7K4F1_9FIRM|nr:TetR/AcrR family transcriptional regulator [Alkalibaculum sporogenes]MPW24251.1 TetR family transcriptional regulator [Alkalibaculum sporogenes]